MDKTTIRQFLAYSKEFRDQIHSDLRDYEFGGHYTGEIRDGNRVDTTKQTIAALKHRLANAEKLIGAYEDLLK